VPDTLGGKALEENAPTLLKCLLYHWNSSTLEINNVSEWLELVCGVPRGAWWQRFVVCAHYLATPSLNLKLPLALQVSFQDVSHRHGCTRIVAVGEEVVDISRYTKHVRVRTESIRHEPRHAFGDSVLDWNSAKLTRESGASEDSFGPAANVKCCISKAKADRRQALQPEDMSEQLRRATVTLEPPKINMSEMLS
jgi:hypothetical protein